MDNTITDIDVILFVLYNNNYVAVRVCVYGFEVKEGWLSTDVMLKIPFKIPNLSFSHAVNICYT